MDGEALSALVVDVAGAARPGEEVEAWATWRRDVDVRVFHGDVESLSSAEIAGIGVRVVSDHRVGFAYAGSLEKGICEEVLSDARDNVAYGTPDDAEGLADDPGTPPGIECAAPGFGDTDTDAKVALALELEGATLAADPRIRVVETCTYGDADICVAVANSRGLDVAHRRTLANLTAFAVAGDGEDTQTGFGYTLARDPADLDAAQVAAEAAERACRLLGATQPRSGRVPVVLDQFVVAQLLGVIAATRSGAAVVKGRSIFGGRLGAALAGGAVTLVEDPTDARAFGARPFDAEGVASRRVDAVGNGTLRSFLHNSYTARRLETQTTASAARASYKSPPGVGARALGFAPGDASLADLLRQAEGGVYVQSVSGLHSGVNPVSGDFSTGIEGLWIRDGVLAGPLREATIASTLQRMLLDVAAVGAEVRWLGGGPAVPVLVSEGTLGGA